MRRCAGCEYVTELEGEDSLEKENRTVEGKFRRVGLYTSNVEISPANSPFLTISKIIKSIVNYCFIENNSSKNIQNGAISI